MASGSYSQKTGTALSLVFLLNLLLAFAKLVGGGLIQSVSMQADGIHSLLDAASSAVAIIAIRVASRPPDEGYPYGHHKVETFASLCISAFLFLGCIEIVRESYRRWMGAASPTPALSGFVLMFASMAINLAVSRWERKKGHLYKSEVMIADALHTQSDIWSSFSVIVSLAAARAGYPIVDPIVAVVIAAIIGKAGAQILWESSKVLTDAGRIEAREIEAIVSAIPGIALCHKVRTRGSMGHVYVDLHIHVAPEMSMEAAHLLAHQAESAIMAKFTEVIEVVVHLEPHLPGLAND
jgi:cation diffusion facilitator family transporter